MAVYFYTCNLVTKLTSRDFCFGNRKSHLFILKPLKDKYISLFFNVMKAVVDHFLSAIYTHERCGFYILVSKHELTTSK